MAMAAAVLPCCTAALPAPPALVDDKKLKGMDESRVTIANYWPYASPIFDYIRRAMPWNEPRSLTDHEVYALTAYILAENKLIDAKLVITPARCQKSECQIAMVFCHAFRS